MAYTNSEICEKLCAARAIADRIRAMRYKRATAASVAAGLGEIGCQLHNCLVSADYGRPWREIDYHYARKAKWLLDTSFEPSRIIDRFYSRIVREQRAARVS